MHKTPKAIQGKNGVVVRARLLLQTRKSGQRQRRGRVVSFISFLHVCIAMGARPGASAPGPPCRRAQAAKDTGPTCPTNPSQKRKYTTRVHTCILLSALLQPCSKTCCFIRHGRSGPTRSTHKQQERKCERRREYAEFGNEHAMRQWGQQFTGDFRDQPVILRGPRPS